MQHVNVVITFPFDTVLACIRDIHKYIHGVVFLYACQKVDSYLRDKLIHTQGRIVVAGVLGWNLLPILILYRPLWPYSILIIVWWSYNPIKVAIRLLDSVPFFYVDVLMFPSSLISLVPLPPPLLYSARALPLHPHPLPSTTNRTCRARQTFKHRDSVQAAKGGKESAGSHSGGRRADGGWPPSMVVDGKLNYKRTEGRK